MRGGCRRAPGSGDARQSVGDDRCAAPPSFRHRRQQCEEDRRRVATGVGHQRGAGELRPAPFGEAVDRTASRGEVPGARGDSAGRTLRDHAIGSQPRDRRRASPLRCTHVRGWRTSRAAARRKPPRPRGPPRRRGPWGLRPARGPTARATATPELAARRHAGESRRHAARHPDASPESARARLPCSRWLREPPPPPVGLRRAWREGGGRMGGWTRSRQTPARER